MTTNFQVGDKFPDIELPNQEGKLKRLSRFTQPSQMDQKLGFNDGYPLIVVFYRGFFCPVPATTSRCGNWSNFRRS